MPFGVLVIHRPHQAMAITHLYNNDEGNYASPVAPRGRPGMTARHQSAQALTQSAFFVPPVYGGCNRGTLGCAAPLSGTVIPVASASQFLMTEERGGSQPDQRTVL